MKFMYMYTWMSFNVNSTINVTQYTSAQSFLFLSKTTYFD